MPSSAIVVGEAIFLLVCIYGFYFWYNRNKEKTEAKKLKDMETYRGGVYAEVKLKCEHEECSLKGEIENFHDITPQDLVTKLTCPGCNKQRTIVSQTKKP